MALVLDSSVVIAFVQTDDAHHPGVRDRILAARQRNERFVLPASVLAESLVGAYRAGTVVADEMREDLVRFFGPVRPVDEVVAATTAHLRSTQRSLRFADALVVATGVVEDATVLTCDQQLASTDHPVEVIRVL